ncbi:type 1 glutamine amidotransferase domain-containing protein [Mammaliicoccus sciuri]|uniref:type 1 glutamine amidotransferase domain-containing protein n=1 Tax=Mammaliicoccus sciuri TaxID=1296 RepID=UPI001FB315CA|nr:type 1 glutamine amidotransferase domain-containing protein [Mammaliicoccus sciuri]MCJ1761409.1 type 1 glutamine amidotransferase domain-containing protein [Mammaliicoccus sciuri]MDO0950987.1 type 1 glutamine amidotransferase domain-containing protein [Mammaliicoccus sciuri]
MKKIMIVNTSADYYEGTRKPTGLWLGELVHFYDYFNSEDYQIDLFNINGGETPIDPVSLNPLMLDKVTKAYYNDHTFMEKLKNSPSISEANPETYDVIYFTGGHGVMFDFPHNMYIQDAVNEVYRQGGVVAAVCHGIAALLNVKDESGRYFIDRKQITGFSNAEEILANRKRLVPFMLESELKIRDAKYSKAKVPFRPYVQIDNRLVTGQNPQSPKQVAQAVASILSGEGK